MTLSITTIIGLVGVVLTLTSCGGGRSSRDRNDGVAITGIDGRVSIIRPGPDANAAYGEGLDLKNQGNCGAAVAKLRPVAGIGPGYENAQTALGSCLLITGTTDKELSSDYLDGLTWLRRAADAGWPEAKSALAAAHAFGPATIRNGSEAAYWLNLYQGNAGKSRIGFVPMPAADIAAIENALTASEKEAGAARAGQWQRKVWLPPAPQTTSPDSPPGSRGRPQRARPAPL